MMTATSTRRLGVNDNAFTMEELLQSDVDELNENPHYRPEEMSGKFHGARWGTFGQIQDKTIPARRDSLDSSYGSMFSPREKFSDDLFSPSLISQPVPKNSPQSSPLDGRQDSGYSTSPTEVIQVAREAQAALEDEANAKRARSERARKAANQRHARPKMKSRPHDASDKNTKAYDQRETVREKNRVAASKCRRKKKASESSLETIYRDVAATHNHLKREVRELRDELTLWRTLALDHLQGNDGCNCGDIQQYNKNQAHMTALNVQCQSAYLGSDKQQGGFMDNGTRTRNPRFEGIYNATNDNSINVEYPAQAYEPENPGRICGIT